MKRPSLFLTKLESIQLSQLVLKLLLANQLSSNADVPFKVQVSAHCSRITLAGDGWFNQTFCCSVWIRKAHTAVSPSEGPSETHRQGWVGILAKSLPLPFGSQQEHQTLSSASSRSEFLKLCLPGSISKSVFPTDGYLDLKWRSSKAQSILCLLLAANRAVQCRLSLSIAHLQVLDVFLQTVLSHPILLLDALQVLALLCLA